MIDGKVREFIPETDREFLKRFSRFDPTGVVTENPESAFDFGLIHIGEDGQPTMAGLVIQSATVVLLADLPKGRLSKRHLFGFSSFLEAVAKEMNRRGIALMNVFVPTQDRRVIHQLERLRFQPGGCWLKLALPPVSKQKTM